MISCISSGGSFSGIFNYHEKKISKGKAKVIGGSDGVKGLSLNTTKQVFEGIIQEYREQPRKGRKLETIAFHPSLNFPQEDKEKLSDELLNQLSKQYLQAMGYGSCEYLAVRHFDRNHDHVHLVVPKIDQNGLRVSDSMERRKAVKVDRQLEEQHELSVATDPSRKQTNALEQNRKELKRLYNGGKDIDTQFEHLAKTYIDSAIAHTLQQEQVKDAASYRSKLETLGVQVTDRIRQGKTAGIVYSLKDFTGKQATCYTLNASKTQKRMTLHNLEKHFASQANQVRKTQTQQEELKGKERDWAPVRKRIAQTITEQKVTDFKTLESALGKKGIRLIRHENENRGFYGISFEVEGERISGSKLGDNFSKSGISRLLNMQNEKGKKLAGRNDIKSDLKTEVGKVLEMEKVQNLDQLEKELNLRNIQLVKAENSGGVYGISFQYGKEKFKGSELGKAYSYQRIIKRLEQKETAFPAEKIISPDESEGAKEYIRTSIRQAIAGNEAYNIDSLSQSLQWKGIELVKAENSGGVYGVSFIFDRQRFKGSELGKSFTFKSLDKSLEENRLSAESLRELRREFVEQALEKACEPFACINFTKISENLHREDVSMKVDDKGNASFEYRGEIFQGNELNFGQIPIRLHENMRRSFGERCERGRKMKRLGERIKLSAYDGPVYDFLMAQEQKLEQGRFSTSEEWLGFIRNTGIQKGEWHDECLQKAVVSYNRLASETRQYQKDLRAYEKSQTLFGRVKGFFTFEKVEKPDKPVTAGRLTKEVSLERVASRPEDVQEYFSLMREQFGIYRGYQPSEKGWKAEELKQFREKANEAKKELELSPEESRKWQERLAELSETPKPSMQGIAADECHRLNRRYIRESIFSALSKPEVTDWNKLGSELKKNNITFKREGVKTQSMEYEWLIHRIKEKELGKGYMYSAVNRYLLKNELDRIVAAVNLKTDRLGLMIQLRMEGMEILPSDEVIFRNFQIPLSMIFKEHWKEISRTLPLTPGQIECINDLKEDWGRNKSYTQEKFQSAPGGMTGKEFYQEVRSEFPYSFSVAGSGLSYFFVSNLENMVSAAFSFGGIHSGEEEERNRNRGRGMSM